MLFLSATASTWGCEYREELAGVILEAAPDSDALDAAVVESPPSDGDRSGPGGRDGDRSGPSEDFEDQGDESGLIVTGREARTWPFPLAAWPLEQPLAEVFGERQRVRFSGSEARALSSLAKNVALGVYGPAPRHVGVRDEQGSLYVLGFSPAQAEGL